MDRFEVIKKIGSGNFGVAHLLRDKTTHELFAAKYIERGSMVKPYYTTYNIHEYNYITFTMLYFSFSVHVYINIVCHCLD